MRKVPGGFEERYPNIKIVHGNFDDLELISNTAAQNEIVIRQYHPHFKRQGFVLT